jgi:F0F1-type ATP synthase membrane subunit c/vacuolar-type H+-ATPase subunit K
VQNGDIICSEEGGLILCDEDYQPSIYGVITSNPSLAFESPDFDGPLAVTSGDAVVRVSTINGAIAVGDLITTSKTPGVGQKATVNGFALGLAMEAFDSASPDDVGQILVSINIHPTSSFVGSRSNLVSNIRQALSAPVVAPLDSFRYLLAFVVALISFALGFVYFGRVVRSGVEAIGRNPLAARSIQLTVFVNIIITIVIVLTGLAISLLILII